MANNAGHEVLHGRNGVVEPVSSMIFEVEDGVVNSGNSSPTSKFVYRDLSSNPRNEAEAALFQELLDKRKPFAAFQEHERCLFSEQEVHAYLDATLSALVATQDLTFTRKLFLVEDRPGGFGAKLTDQRILAFATSALKGIWNLERKNCPVNFGNEISRCYYDSAPTDKIQQICVVFRAAPISVPGFDYLHSLSNASIKMGSRSALIHLRKARQKNVNFIEFRNRNADLTLQVIADFLSARVMLDNRRVIRAE